MKNVRGDGTRRRIATRIETSRTPVALEQTAGEAAVDRDDGARDVARGVGGEEAGDRRDLRGLAEAAEGDLLEVVLAGAVRVEVGEPRRVDLARSDRVHGDLVRA